jgi:hypothetical protein
MLTIAARIPDAAARDQFADRLAHKARITEEVVRAEIRKAAVQKHTTVEEQTIRSLGQIKPAERGLIWALMRDTRAGLAAMADVEAGDLDRLATAGILRQAQSLQGFPEDALPSTLMERLSKGEAALIEDICRQEHPPAAAFDCVIALKKLRLERERADVQREIDRVQEQGSGRDEAQIDRLLVTMRDLSQRIEALAESAPSKVPG